MRDDTTHDDDQIPFPMAAKALRVSRRTVERLIERGELERAAGAPVASVTRRSLNDAVERRDSARAQLPPERAAGAIDLDGAPLLILLDQLSTANRERSEAERTASDLKVQLLQIEAAAGDRARIIDERDALIETLVNGSRRDRRAARRMARSTS